MQSNIMPPTSNGVHLTLLNDDTLTLVALIYHHLTHFHPNVDWVFGKSAAVLHQRMYLKTKHLISKKIDVVFCCSSFSFAEKLL